MMATYSIATAIAAFSTIITASSATSYPGLFVVARRGRHRHHHCRTGDDHRSSLTRINLYRKFHEYAWDKLMTDNDDNKALMYDTVPDGLRTNTSPVKGNASPGTNVVATIRSVSRFPFLELDRKVTDVKGHDNDDNIGNDWNPQVLRLSRTAFLETQTPSNEALITNMTIHVLNFVSFPSANIRNQNGSSNNSGKDRYLGLPIFGADIVTLPGNKHLVALDFQPVLPLDEENGKSIYSLFPEQYSLYEDRLRVLHSKYQKSDNDSIAPLLAWGGDIPEKARRFFSPYALWTRLGDANALDIVNTVVWEAFREYTDLYMELMCAVQCDVDSGILEFTHPSTPSNKNPVWRGQLDYLAYRRTNDPARPMLQRLYGNEWSESVIGDVLFPDL